MSVDKDKMDEIFGALGDDSIVAILVHPFPDPDCFGAAAGMAVLLKEVYGLCSKIYHFGEISHPQNKSMKNVLHISLSDGNDFSIDDVGATVVLDTDLIGSNFANDVFKSADLRIDHHTTERSNGATISDVRLVGSTSAIVWDYLNTFGVSLENYSNEATALVLGIKTDTGDFTSSNTSELDMEAFRALLPFVNKLSLSKVTKYPLPKGLFETEARAYREKEIRNTMMVSYVGDIIAHNRDFIPTIADRMSRMDGINTAVIIGIIDDHVVASVRSDDPRVDVTDLCTNIFGKEYAGGKDGSGGARFPLGPTYALLDNKETRDMVKAEVVKSFKNRFFKALGEQEEGVE